MTDDGYHIGTVNLTGWKAVVAGIAILAMIAACTVNLRDMPVKDTGMLDAIKVEIKTRHMRRISGELQKHLNAGDRGKASAAGRKIAGLKIDIESAAIAYPAIRHFSKRKKEAVVKVAYSVETDGNPGHSRTAYFELFRAPFCATWSCRREVGRMSYYIRVYDND